jgi:hypothetical protein
MLIQGTQNTQHNLQNENKVGGLKYPELKTYHTATKTVCQL